MSEEIQPTTASISTMWAINNYPDLNAFFMAARKLGFQKIELNHQVNSSMLSNINLDHIQFSSIHEPCPTVITTKELVERDWLISSTNEISRKHGVDAVKKSINLAHRFAAPVVVIHCGSITSIMDFERKLRNIFNKGNAHSEEYQRIKSQAIQSRADKCGSRINAVNQSLNELIDYADRFQIRLGLENRYHFMDIPSIDEMDELLSLAGDDHLGFIYDVGHAQALDRLGFYTHADWLKRYSSRMFGVHLHDVVGVSDHLAPGLGEIDFKKIASYLPENSFRTVELQPGNTLAQVKNGIDLLVETGCIRYL
jgi:sugar phosphate isomerase/epimerase